ncbi:MAG: glycosyltransferase family 4 protein [Thiogranum sp.]
MNICIFGSSFLPQRGGMEYVMHHLATALHQLGNDVTVIAERVRWEPVGVEHDYRLIRYGPAIRGLRGVGLEYISGLLAVLRAHMQNPFDVIHCHGVAIGGRRAAVLKKWLNIPLVMTPHGEDIQRIPEIDYGLRLDPRWDRAIKRNLDAADAVTAISASVARELTHIDQEKIFPVANGIHLSNYGKRSSNFLHDRLNLDRDTSIILSVGRNHIKKGYAYGIKAVERLLADNPDMNLHYALVGRGVSELAPLVTEKRLGKTVSLIEEVSPDQVRECYHSSHVFFSPSIIEGLSLVSIEAIACGLPLVVTNVPGNEDIVQENDCGLIVESKNPDDMARGLHTLLSNKEMREAFGKKALVSARSYDWLKIAERYCDVYARITNPQAH